MPLVYALFAFVFIVLALYFIHCAIVFRRENNGDWINAAGYALGCVLALIYIIVKNQR